MMKLFLYVTLFVIATNCQKDKNEDSKNDDKPSDEAASNAGTIEIYSANMSGLIAEVNQSLVSDGQSLDVSEEAIDAIPGNINVDNSSALTTQTGQVTSYKFTFDKLEFSSDGKSWEALALKSPLEVDVLGGSDAVEASIPAGTYSYVYAEVDGFKFTRQGCDEVAADNEDFGAVLTTSEIARTYGQRTDQVFAEYIGHTYWDLLQELFYYARTRPVDLRESPDLLLVPESVDPWKSNDAYKEAEAYLEWAKTNTSRQDPYNNPETVDNTRPQCKGDAPEGSECNDYLATNTHVANDGKKIDSYYWLLAEPIEIAAGEKSSLIITIDPTGIVLGSETCGVAPRDPIFIIGSQEQVTASLKEFGKKK